MNNPPAPIDRRQFDARQLVADHPPRLRHANKKVVHEIACPSGTVHQGQLEYTRWAAMPLPDRVDTRSAWPGWRIVRDSSITRRRLINPVRWNGTSTSPMLISFLLMAQTFSPRTKCRWPNTLMSWLKEALNEFGLPR